MKGRELECYRGVLVRPWAVPIWCVPLSSPLSTVSEAWEISVIYESASKLTSLPGKATIAQFGVVVSKMSSFTPGVYFKRYLCVWVCWVLAEARRILFASCRISHWGARTPTVACGLSLWCSALVALSCMWDLPGKGMEPVSLALQGGFLTPGPPEKTWLHVILLITWPQSSQHLPDLRLLLIYCTNYSG